MQCGIFSYFSMIFSSFLIKEVDEVLPLLLLLSDELIFLLLGYHII